MAAALQWVCRSHPVSYGINGGGPFWLVRCESCLSFQLFVILLRKLRVDCAQELKTKKTTSKGSEAADLAVSNYDQRKQYALMLLPGF